MHHLGHYVTYKGNNYVVVGTVTHIKSRQLRINAPDQQLIQVNEESVTPYDCSPATVRIVSSGAYIVTDVGNIFSEKTGRLMKWDINHGVRKELLNHLTKIRPF